MSSRQSTNSILVGEDIRGSGRNPGLRNECASNFDFVADLSKWAMEAMKIKRTPPMLMSVISHKTLPLLRLRRPGHRGREVRVDRATLGPKLKLRPDQMIILAQSAGHPKP